MNVILTYNYNHNNILKIIIIVQSKPLYRLFIPFFEKLRFVTSPSWLM